MADATSTVTSSAQDDRQDNIEVPDRFREPIRWFAALSTADADRLMQVLEMTPPAARLSDFAADASERANLPERTRLTVERLLSAVLTAAEAGGDRGPIETASEIGSLAGFSLGLSADESALLAKRFARIASLKAPRLSVKFTRLSLAYDKRLCDGTFKIITDIRPVFDDDLHEVVGGFVSHTVQATVHRAPDDRVEQVSFHVDSGGLAIMLDEIKRALVKEETSFDTLTRLRPKENDVNREHAE